MIDAGDEPGGDQAWRHVVHPEPVAWQLGGQGLGQHPHAAFRGVVKHLAGAAGGHYDFVLDCERLTTAAPGSRDSIPRRVEYRDGGAVRGQPDCDPKADPATIADRFSAIVVIPIDHCESPSIAAIRLPLVTCTPWLGVPRRVTEESVRCSVSDRRITDDGSAERDVDQLNIPTDS